MTEAGGAALVLANPAGLWLGLLLLPVLLIYLLRGRPPRVTVSSLLLWRDGAHESQAQIFSRVRWPERGAWLQLLALLLIILAATDPGLSSPSVAPRLALILDVSASMQTQELAGQTRLELAKAAARDWMRHAHPDTDVALIAAGRSARLLSPFGAERSVLAARLDALVAEDCEGEISAAIDLAREQLGRSLGQRELVLITDGALADPLASVPDSRFEHTVRVGTPQVNAAIVQLEVGAAHKDTNPDGTFGVQSLVTLKNYGLQARKGELQLHQRNVAGVLAAQSIDLEPGAERFVTLDFDATPADQGTGIWVELVPGDALAADDRAYAVVPLYAKQPVVVVADTANPWLIRALQADRGVELSQLTPNQLDPALLPPAALVVYSGFCPNLAPPASFVVLNPKPGTCFDLTIGPETSDLRFTHWDEQDLRFRFAELDDVQLTRAHALLPKSSADALAWSHGTALIARAAVYDRQGTVLGFDLADSNWPLQTSFVLFVRNLVELAKGPLGPASRTTQTGQTLSISVPSDVTKIAMREPGPALAESGPPSPTLLQTPPPTPATISAQDGRALLPQLTRAGFYHFSWQGNKPGSSLAAASLLSPRESDPAQRDVPILAPRENVTQGPPPTRFELSPWLAAAALLVLGLEMLLATRLRAKHLGVVA